MRIVCAFDTQLSSLGTGLCRPSCSLPDIAEPTLDLRSAQSRLQFLESENVSLKQQMLKRKAHDAGVAGQPSATRQLAVAEARALSAEAEATRLRAELAQVRAGLARVSEGRGVTSGVAVRGVKNG